ncbi:hypothetical protein HYALB_00008736 [Hymenoscyphus albidus]|uniref:Uncharacterized protein n=1 Tax=Hymenoscyphus albidus TaxID=595503 RepID=A0A9N9LSN7_9HELO|nr:hypothetical protein HYALB_00008736 [Hymenoscyphus albidus]
MPSKRFRLVNSVAVANSVAMAGFAFKENVLMKAILPEHEDVGRNSEYFRNLAESLSYIKADAIAEKQGCPESSGLE